MKSAAQPFTLRRGSRRQPEVSRTVILQAALVEFAQEGLAGARMDAIAEAAGVNKALLYYYFRDKDTLYGAVLDSFFVPLHDRVVAVCDQPGTAGERFLSYAKAHFDSIAESPHYARIFMGELMSASRGGSTHLDRIVEKHMLPIGLRVLGLVQEGVASGEFRPVDAAQFVPSAIGSIVHYFLTAPLRKKFSHADPRLEQSVDQRRVAVLDFIAAALFADRDAGVELAAKLAGSNTKIFELPPPSNSAAQYDSQETNPERAAQRARGENPVVTGVDLPRDTRLEDRSHQPRGGSAVSPARERQVVAGDRVAPRSGDTGSGAMAELSRRTPERRAQPAVRRKKGKRK